MGKRKITEGDNIVRLFISGFVREMWREKTIWETWT